MKRFCIPDERYSDLDPDTFLDIEDEDAIALLRWLGYDPPPFWGVLPISDLKARCVRRTWPIARNFDRGTPGRVAGTMWVLTHRLLNLLDRSDPEFAVAFY